MKTVRWGIVGAGRIAHTFARDIAFCEHAALQAVAARRAEGASSFGDQHAVPEVYVGYEALYAAESVDAVYVATPHNLHLQHAGDALRSGKAVLCEKPITTTADECRRLIQVARHANAFLMEAMWTWFLPAVQTAYDWVQAGRIGAIKRIHADFGYPIEYSATRREYDAGLAGGCLLEMGVYPVALALLFTDLDPHRVDVIARMAPNNVEDDVVFTFDYPDFVASLGTSYRCKLRNWAYIIGEDGYVAIPDFWRANECQLWVLDEIVDQYDDERKGSGFEFQIESASRDIIAGRLESTTVPLEQSLRIQRHMDRVRACF